MEQNVPQALSGIRVLDFGRVLAAPWAAQTLAELGAEVIKIERPGTGDDGRRYGRKLPPPEGIKAESSFFLCANRNKKSVTVDIGTPEGAEIVRELVKISDVLIENFIPGTMKKFGLDYDRLSKVNPRLIYCSVTGYGQEGLYSSRPGYDAVFQAHSGMMSITGLPDNVPGGGPMKTGPSLIDVTTGQNATIGILAALHMRDQISGRGQHIDAPLLDTAISIQSHVIQEYLVTGEQPPRNGTQGNGGHPACVFNCLDGQIYISAGNDAHFHNLCRVLGCEELIVDPQFATLESRGRNRVAMNATMVPNIQSWKRDELVDALVAARVPCSPVNTYGEFFDDPHVRERHIRRSMEHPSAAAGSFDFVASPIRLSESAEVQERPPLLGEHTDDVLSGLLCYSDDKLRQLRQGGKI